MNGIFFVATGYLKVLFEEICKRESDHKWEETVTRNNAL